MREISGCLAIIQVISALMIVEYLTKLDIRVKESAVKITMFSSTEINLKITD